MIIGNVPEKLGLREWLFLPTVPKVYKSAKHQTNLSLTWYQGNQLFPRPADESSKRASGRQLRDNYA